MEALTRSNSERPPATPNIGSGPDPGGGTQGGHQLTLTERGRVEPHWEVRQSQAGSAKVRKEVPGSPRRHLTRLITVEGEYDGESVGPGNSDGPLGLGACQRRATRCDGSPMTAAVDTDGIYGALADDERLDLTTSLTQEPPCLPGPEELLTLAKGAVRRGVDVLGRPLVRVIDAARGEPPDPAVQETSNGEHDAASKPVVEASRLSSSDKPGVETHLGGHAMAVEEIGDVAPARRRPAEGPTGCLDPLGVEASRADPSIDG